MKNYDQSVEINHNPNWPYIPDHPYRIVIIGSSGSDKTNVLLNLTKVNDQILAEFIYMSKIYSNQSINYLLTEEKNEELKNPKAFIGYSQTIEHIYENLEDYNSAKKRRVLIVLVFDDMIADMESNKKLSPIVTELLLRERKLKISLLLYHNVISKCLRL